MSATKYRPRSLRVEVFCVHALAERGKVSLGELAKEVRFVSVGQCVTVQEGDHTFALERKEYLVRLEWSPGHVEYATMDAAELDLRFEPVKGGGTHLDFEAEKLRVERRLLAMGFHHNEMAMLLGECKSKDDLRDFSARLGLMLREGGSA